MSNYDKWIIILFKKILQEVTFKHKYEDLYEECYNYNLFHIKDMPLCLEHLNILLHHHLHKFNLYLIIYSINTFISLFY